jgi:hypothetical protein
MSLCTFVSVGHRGHGVAGRHHATGEHHVGLARSPGASDSSEPSLSHYVELQQPRIGSAS